MTTHNRPPPTSTANKLASLPDDALTLALSHLDRHDLAAATTASNTLRNLAIAENLYHSLLRKLLLKHAHWDIAHTQLASLTRRECMLVMHDLAAHAAEADADAAACGDAPASTQTRLVNGDPKHVAVVADALVRYVGPVIGGDRAVRSSLPFPVAPVHSLRAVRDDKAIAYRFDRPQAAYFEVSISQSAQSRAWSGECVAVGLCSAGFRLQGCQPGWDVHSFGYHSDDGRIFHGSGSDGQPFGPLFGSGDVVGCGLSLTSLRVFFTLNGRLLGAPFVACEEHLPLHPVVGLDSHAPCFINLGERPFAYDVDDLPDSVHAATSPGMHAVEAVREAFFSALECFTLPAVVSSH